jgi:hypothetical protein
MKTSSIFVHCALANPCLMLNKTGTEVPNGQSMKTETLGNFKWLSIDGGGGQAKLTENLRASPFNRETFIQIYLDWTVPFCMWEFFNQYVQYMYCTFNLLPLFEVPTSVLLLLVQKPNS